MYVHPTKEVIQHVLSSIKHELDGHTLSKLVEASLACNSKSLNGKMMDVLKFVNFSRITNQEIFSILQKCLQLGQQCNIFLLADKMLKSRNLWNFSTLK